MSKTVIDESMIHGEIAPGFREVETEFKKNFTQRGELGAPDAPPVVQNKIVAYCRADSIC